MIKKNKIWDFMNKVLILLVLFLIFFSCERSISKILDYENTDKEIQKAVLTGVNVNYVISNDWGSGFVADVNIINSSGTPVNGWTVLWTFPGNQSIVNIWNASFTQEGSSITVENAGWNGIIPDGGQVNFGFQAVYTGANDVPADIRVEGQSTSSSSSISSSSSQSSSISSVSSSSISSSTSSSSSSNSGTVYTGNSTYYTHLGAPYGGCGIPVEHLDSVHFAALNVQNSPGDYTTFLERPISAEYADKIGMFNNGLNCGRWVKVVISDFCNGINDGAPGEPFCHDGSGWTSDVYNGAELYMIIADSCHDGNAWCRDDPYHIDLSYHSLNEFELNGVPVGDMVPDHYNNRQVQWEFVEAPNYTGDIKIGFMSGANVWWSAIAVTHLKNGIHGVDYFDGSSWVKAEMNSDMGQSYIIGPTVQGVGNYRIRVYDVNDQLINNGRVYKFSIPGVIDSALVNVPYTIE